MSKKGIVLVLSIILPAPAYTGQTGNFNAARSGTTYIIPNDDAPAYAPELTDANLSAVRTIQTNTAIQVQWNHPRDIYAVRLISAAKKPEPNDVEFKYWHHVWPDNGAGGWMKVDDPYNGRFVTAAVDTNGAKENELLFGFKPLAKDENPDIKETGHNFRRTYKIMVEFKKTTDISEIECLTDSIYKEATIKIGLPGREWDGKLEPRNADIISLQRPDISSAVIKTRYADNLNRLSPDRGYIIVRQNSKGTNFSFFIDDVIRDGAIHIRDINAFISDATKNLSSSDRIKPIGEWDATVTEKVAAMPEQTFERAMASIPAKWVPDAHLGLPVLRQEISIDPSSQIYVYSKSLRGIGSDTDRVPGFPEEWSQITHSMITRKDPFAPPGPKRIKRWLEDGYLPVIHSNWQDENIDYHQTIFVTALDQTVLIKSLQVPQTAALATGTGIHAADFGSGPIP